MALVPLHGTVFSGWSLTVGSESLRGWAQGLWLLSEHRGTRGPLGWEAISVAGRRKGMDMGVPGSGPGALDKLPSPAEWGLTGLWFRGSG